MSEAGAKPGKGIPMNTRGNEALALPSVAPEAWTELEQAFFDAAPPDEQGPAPELTGFDDLLPTAAGPRRGPARLQKAAPSRLRPVLDGGARLLEGWMIWVVFATVSLLVGLSAVSAARGVGDGEKAQQHTSDTLPG
jgi:hypothetical protein